MRLQIVFAIASSVPELGRDEVDAVGLVLAGAVRGLGCSVVSHRSGGPWLEVILDAEPTFNLARAMTSLKAVTSRRIHGMRGGAGGIWAPGYAAVTLGRAIDPEEFRPGLDGRGQG